MRSDYKRLKFVEKEFNRKHSGSTGMLPPNEEEDYGLDVVVTSRTEPDGVMFEVKTLKRKFDWDYLTKRAGRNSKCRYCYSADTKEEMEADDTPMPAWLKGKKPIHVLNATDRNGRYEGSKIHTILAASAGLILITEWGLLIYSPLDLHEAILGDFWIKVKHTTEFNDDEELWEKKVAIDLNGATEIIECEVPEELLR